MRRLAFGCARASAGVDADFLILGTGFGVDLADRPELSAIAGDIATWSDRYEPPADRTNAEMGRHPYVGPGFELMETATRHDAGTAPRANVQRRLDGQHRSDFHRP